MCSKLPTAFILPTGIPSDPSLDDARCLYKESVRVNRCGPTCWAMVSTPLIAMMHTANFGFKIISALSLAAIHLVCYAFVGNTDVMHMCADPNVNRTTLLSKCKMS